MRERKHLLGTHTKKEREGEKKCEHVQGEWHISLHIPIARELSAVEES